MAAHIGQIPFIFQIADKLANGVLGKAEVLGYLPLAGWVVNAKPVFYKGKYLLLLFCQWFHGSDIICSFDHIVNENILADFCA